MEKPWMKSILQLQDIVNDNIAPQKSPEAQNHLQCLIDCIQEMYEDQRRLKDDLEKTAIKAHGLRYDQKVKKVETVIETQNVIEQTKQEEQTAIQNFTEETASIEEDIKIAEEKVVLLENENKQLEVVAKTARNKATTLSVVANDVMKKRHEIVVVIRKKRQETFDAHDTAYSYVDVLKDIHLDVKQYSEYYRKQIHAVEKRAKVWHKKAETERKKSIHAKDECKVVEHTLKKVRRVTHCIQFAIAQHTERWTNYSIRIDRISKNDHAMRDENERLVTRIRNLEEEYVIDKAYLRELLKDKAQVIEIIKDDRYDEEVIYKVILKEKIELEEDLSETNENLACVRSAVEDVKEVARILTDRVEDALDAIVGRRSQRMGFKENLIVVADRRETMENIFAVSFDEQYDMLRSETVLRMKAAREATKMLEEHEQYLIEFDDYRQTCVNAAALNRNVFATLQGDGSDMVENLRKRRKAIAQLRAELEIAKAELDDIKIHSHYTLKRLIDNKDYLEIQVQHLKENVLSVLLKNVTNLTQKCLHEKTVYNNLATEYTKHFRLFNVMKQEIKYANENITEKGKVTICLKKELRKARLDGLRQLIRHICDMARIDREIYVRMWKCSTLKGANEDIVDHIKFTSQEKLADQQEWHSCESFIAKSATTLQESKELFRFLVKKGNAMTHNAINGGDMDLQKLQYNLGVEMQKSKILGSTHSNLMPVLNELGKVSSDISDLKHAGEGESRRQLLRQSKRRLLKRNLTF